MTKEEFESKYPLIIAWIAETLERVGYWQCPLEVIAYTLGSVFNHSPYPFDVAIIVRAQLDMIL